MTENTAPRSYAWYADREGNLKSRPLPRPGDRVMRLGDAMIGILTGGDPEAIERLDTAMNGPAQFARVQPDLPEGERPTPEAVAKAWQDSDARNATRRQRGRVF